MSNHDAYVIEYYNTDHLPYACKQIVNKCDVIAVHWFKLQTTRYE